jgi:hypothetical protein
VCVCVRVSFFLSLSLARSLCVHGRCARGRRAGRRRAATGGPANPLRRGSGGVRPRRPSRNRGGSAGRKWPPDAARTPTRSRSASRGSCPRGGAVRAARGVVRLLSVPPSKPLRTRARAASRAAFRLSWSRKTSVSRPYRASRERGAAAPGRAPAIRPGPPLSGRPRIPSSLACRRRRRNHRHKCQMLLHNFGSGSPLVGIELRARPNATASRPGRQAHEPMPASFQKLSMPRLRQPGEAPEASLA